MEFGEIKAADDEDFQRMKRLCLDHDGWKQEVNRDNVMVWTKQNEMSDFNMVKVCGLWAVGLVTVKCVITNHYVNTFLDNQCTV